MVPSVSLPLSAEPYSEYKVWIRAYTLKNEGKPSEPLFVVTDVRAPGAPVVANLTCQNANTMFLKWLRPKLFHRTVDVYHVMYRREGEDKWEKQVVETVNNTVNHMVSQWVGIIWDSFAFTRPQSTCHLFIDCFRLIIPLSVGHDRDLGLWGDKKRVWLSPTECKMSISLMAVPPRAAVVRSSKYAQKRLVLFLPH